MDFVGPTTQCKSKPRTSVTWTLVMIIKNARKPDDIGNRGKIPRGNDSFQNQ